MLVLLFCPIECLFVLLEARRQCCTWSCIPILFQELLMLDLIDARALKG